MSHPSDADLLAFVAGQLPAPRLAEVERHVNHCSECQDKLDKLNRPGSGQTPRPFPLQPTPSESGPVRLNDGTGAGASSPPYPGAAESPRYEILEPLGVGGMGVVYKARQLELNRLVALKRLVAGTHATPDQLRRFRTEAEAIARVRHPNVIQVYEVGTYDGQPCFALEYADGGTLAERVRGGPLQPCQAAEVIEALARGVQAAHDQGLVHRDLKPTNILLVSPSSRSTPSPQEKGKNGAASTVVPPTAGGVGATEPAASATAKARELGQFIPKITDFGLTRWLSEDRHQTPSNTVVGTPAYMAPEQAGSSSAVGPPADIWALGAILYELLTGRPPFQAPTPLDTLMQVCGQEPVPVRRLQPAVPRDLETICHKCLHKEPARRYATAHHLADDLRRFLEGRPILARRAGHWERGWKWAKRQPAKAALVGGGVLVAVAAILWGWIYTAQVRQFNQDLQAALREADASFQDARDAVDFFAEVGEVDLREVPGVQKVRQKMLAKAREYYRSFARQREGDSNVQAQLGQAYFRLGLITQDLGSSADAVQYLEKSRQIQEELHAKDPSDKELIRNLARTCNNLGTVQVETRQFPAALKSYHRATDLRELLRKEGAGEPTLISDLAGTYMNWGNLLSDMDQQKEAIQRFRQALSIQEELYQKEKLRTPWFLREYLNTLHNFGKVLTRAGREEEAQKMLARAGEVAEQLEPLATGHEHRYTLSIASEQTGMKLAKAGKYPEALKELEKALQIRERLTNENQDVLKYKQALGVCCDNIGTVYKMMGQIDEAVKWHKKAIEIEEKILGESPGLEATQQNLALSWGRLGTAQAVQKKWAEAAESLAKSVELWKQLAAKYPEETSHQRNLGEACFHLGNVKSELREREEALRVLGEARAVQAQLVDKEPNNLKRRSDLGNTLNNLAANLHELNRSDEAMPFSLESVRHQKVCVVKQPEDASYRDYLGFAYRNLGNICLAVGQHAEAFQVTKDYLDLWRAAPTGARFVWAGGVRSRCISQVGKGKPQLAPAEQEKLREFYAQAAMDALRQAAGMGYRDAARLKKNDPAFEPLRSRPEFQQLIQDLEAKAIKP